MHDGSYIITKEEIDLAVSRLADTISKEYKGEPLLAVCVLKGAVIFYADLVRKLTTPVRMDFVAVSSYGAGTVSSGEITFRARTHISDEELKDYHVLIVEDIVDTGNTLYWLEEYFKSKQPLSVKLCTLIDKPSRRVANVQADYYGFSIPDRFIVGYGMDCNELYRELPYIADIDYVKSLETT
jgi:hypoxanthine phosphoribosyltransferase